MFTTFCTSLIGLCVASIMAFVAAFRHRSKFLVVCVPAIALCGSMIYTSYMSVVGYPAELKWDNLPDKITVIYFQVSGKKSITLWLREDDTTRLVRLPYNEAAEDGLEAQRQKMGKGYPVKYKRGGQKGKGQGKGKLGKGKPGRSRKGDKKDGAPGKGWKYRVESHGIPIAGEGLPPK